VKTIQVTPGGPSSLSGVKRGGILFEMDHSLVQKKGRGRIMLFSIMMWLGTWRRLENSATAPNEYSKLELPGVWEPRGSSHPSQPDEGSRAHSFVFNGNKT
jgi:hypothetical protein